MRSTQRVYAVMLMLATLALPAVVHAQTDTTRTNPLAPSDTSAFFAPADTSAQSDMQAQAAADSAYWAAYYAAASTRSTRLGFFGGADFTMQSATLILAKQPLDHGIICDCQFREGSGFGFNIGVALSFGFSNDLYSQNIRLAYALRRARSSVYDSVFVFDPVDRQNHLEVTEERFDLNYKSVNFELLFTRTLPIKGVSLYVIAGPSLGLILTNHYSLTLVTSSSETKPEEGILENIEHLNTSLIAGVGARFKLGRSTALLQPEILYTYPFDRISRKYNWSFDSFRGNVALMFTL